jgi:hypothetical protein
MTLLSRGQVLGRSYPRALVCVRHMLTNQEMLIDVHGITRGHFYIGANQVGCRYAFMRDVAVENGYLS